MTVSSTSSACGANAADTQASFKQTRADFQALSAALQSGDLTSAQQALAQLQQDNPRLAQAMNSAPSSSDSSRLSDLKSLSSALQSGDLAGAQQALSQLQQSAPGAPGAQAVAGHHHHHHHHGASGAEAAAPDANSTTGDDPTDPTAGSVLNVSA